MSCGVLITAGASGIGRAMGEAFSAEGYRVWVADVDAKALAEVSKSWRVSHVNVVDEEGMESLLELADKLFTNYLRV
jgi:short-subunit dehydrogenase involved in D-alanine esterification of teichoic acids